MRSWNSSKMNWKRKQKLVRNLPMRSWNPKLLSSCYYTNLCSQFTNEELKLGNCFRGAEGSFCSQFTNEELKHLLCIISL